jgi:hypothetical protein
MEDQGRVLWGHGSTMLRRISRLPNHVVALLRDEGVEDVVEAEFIPPSGTFPNEFRWEALQHSYAACTVHNPSYLSSPSTSEYWYPSSAQSIDTIDVLWLSPTVFLSFFALCDEDAGEFSYDCSIAFQRREGGAMKGYFFLVYSLSSFFEGEVDEPSLLPFQFFQHVTAFLPVNYFSSITLYRVGIHPERCPVGHLLQFLGIVPTGCCARFILNGRSSITKDELRAIFSFPFHPDVKLGFDHYPFRESVPMIEMLRGVQHLRAIEIPWQVFGTDRGDPEAAPAFQFAVRSSNLMMYASCPLSSSMLETVATIHNVDDIQIKSYRSDSADQESMLDRCIRPFLSGRLNTKRLRVHLFGDTGVFLRMTRIKKWAAAVTVPCKSKTLNSFNVWFYPVRDHAPMNLGDVKEWDTEIFPSLVLNCGEKLIQQPLYEGTLLRAIQAINRGIVYHKITGHHPFDMRMANAGLIYQLLRMVASETQGVGGSNTNELPRHGREARSPPQSVGSSLSGSKRPVAALHSELKRV